MRFQLRYGYKKAACPVMGQAAVQRSFELNGVYQNL